MKQLCTAILVAILLSIGVAIPIGQGGTAFAAASDMSLTTASQMLGSSLIVGGDKIEFSSSDTQYVLKGETLKLKLKNGGHIQWSSGDTSIATVSSTGVVTGKKDGQVLIKAKRTTTGSWTTCVVNVYTETTEAQAYNAIMSLRSTYYEGRRWTNDNFYFWGARRSNSYGCAAFAGIASDTAFGQYAPCRTHNSYDQIKVGDSIRFVDEGHSVIVLKKTSSSITVVEGNYIGTIHWGRTITKSELSKTYFEVWTRYPKSTSKVKKYDIWVGGTQVTSSNAKNVLGNGTVSYNAKTNTLTLKNAKITKAYVETLEGDGGQKTFYDYYGILSSTEKTLTINLVGKNSITTSAKNSPIYNFGIFTAGNLKIGGSGSLSVKANTAQCLSVGILSCSNLTFQGKAKVTAQGSTVKPIGMTMPDDDLFGSFGIAVNSKKNITFTGNAKLTAYGKKRAIMASTSPTIKFSSYKPKVKAGSSSKSIKVNKTNPAKSVYTKYKYENITKATSTGQLTTAKQ